MKAFVQDPNTGLKTPRKLVDFQGILVREDFNPDNQVVIEWPVTYKRMRHAIEGHDVMDVGAHIGMFAVRALEHGAKSVVAYEPEPGSFSVLSENLRRTGKQFKRPTLGVNAAITKKSGVAHLAVAKSGNSSTAGTSFSKRGRGVLEVRAIGLAEALEEHKSTLLKSDCEGEELNFLDGRKLPSSVRVVSAELHREGEGNEERCQRVIESFAKWRPIHAPAGYSFARCWIVAWER